MNEFKPDIVFHINYTVNNLFNDEGETHKNILWITRFRDRVSNELYHPGCDFKYHNMFILPVYFEWGEKLKAIGVPGNRILQTSDGININVFSKKEKTDRQYECDIVCVNNSVGSLDSRLDFYQKNITIEGYRKSVLEVDKGDVERTNEITCYFKENEEVVLFYSRDDLLNKIQYYLDNPEEREMIAANGRKVVIDNFSQTAIAGKTIDFIKEYYRN